jgi:hypothetical protein
MRKIAILIVLAAVTSSCGRPASVAIPKADAGFKQQKSCGLPGDTKTEVEMLNNFDEYRKSYGLWPLSRNCALSRISSDWVLKHPVDDTYDVDAIERALQRTDWGRIGLTLRVKPTAAEAWNRMLVEPTDFVNLKDPRATDVGVAVEHHGGETWVYFITVEALEPVLETAQDV